MTDMYTLQPGDSRVLGAKVPEPAVFQASTNPHTRGEHNSIPE